MDDKINYAFKVSNELNIISKSLLTIGFIGIIFGSFNITITQFIGTKIEGNPELLKGIILVIIIFQIITLFIYTYRDTEKLLYEKTQQIKVGKLIELSRISEQIKNETRKEKKESLKRDKIIHIEHNKKIRLQLFQKYLIFFGFKIIIPIFVGYLGIKSIGIHKVLPIISIINIKDILFLILSSILVYIIFIKKLK